MPCFTSGAPLGCTAFAIKCTVETVIQCIRSPTWVYCISYPILSCHYVHVYQEPHLGVLHLPSSVLHMPSSNIRSNTRVHYISHQVYCGDHAVLVMFYKIQNGLICIPLPSFIVRSSRPKEELPHLFKTVYASTEAYRSSFFVRTVREWNLLPVSIGTLGSLPSFKDGLSSFSPPASL